jgi:tRNA(Ile)-lysidine synthase
MSAALAAARKAAVTSLAALKAPHPLAVAFSGGADSTAILRLACDLVPGRVQAFHIHHGLQDAAHDFERHCVALCEAWQVPLTVVRVQARHAPGESPEDAARRARYAALAEAARSHGAQRVWLGQHADDQVETLVLALSRGAGLPGLAAMPVYVERDGVMFERPLLAVPGAELRAWLRGMNIAWVEDPSNQDASFTRNRIRLQLMPALEAAFPQFRETFARSARHAAQAQALLEQVAVQDLATALAPTAEGGEGGGVGVGAGLLIAPLHAFTRERLANLLRHWLRAVHRTSPTAAQLEEVLGQVAACRTRGHRIHLRVGAGHLERDGPALFFLRSDRGG